MAFGGLDPYTIHLNIATCKWWFPFILVEKAMFQLGKMYLLRSPVEAWLLLLVAATTPLQKVNSFVWVQWRTHLFPKSLSLKILPNSNPVLYHYHKLVRQHIPRIPVVYNLQASNTLKIMLTDVRGEKEGGSKGMG